jgi:glucose-1-phosphate cytidylyltransferase
MTNARPATRSKLDKAGVPVVILAGGTGIAMGPQGSVIPKTMVEVQGSPVLRHVMGHYAAAGFSRFIVCTGAGGALIRRYAASALAGWDLQIVDTGEASMTGSRLAQVRGLLQGGLFCLTYGDTVSDVDLDALLDFHAAHGRTASLTAVHPQTRFRILGMVEDDDAIRGFAARPILQKDYINGGFYVFNADVLSLEALKEDPACVLENDVLEFLVRKRDLNAYRHGGFWQQVDTERDRLRIEGFLAGPGRR